MRSAKILIALLVFLALAAVAFFLLRKPSQPPSFAQNDLSEQDVSDAYIYLFSRLFVLSQQQKDLRRRSKWNEIIHRKPGAVEWPNPNLNVCCSEACWVAMDENSCVLLLTIPEIKVRYYRVHFLNSWGKMLLNIHERTFPDHLQREFTLCYKESKVEIPAGVNSFLVS